jgi:type I restriction enzyme M protein
VCRWNRFRNTDPRDMYAVVSEHVFPWLRTLGGNGTTYSKHMEGARFTIPTPQLLAKVVDMIDKVPMEDIPDAIARTTKASSRR